MVLTSKHHDGYCLWPSKEASTSYGMPWNSVVSGPKRDLVGDLTTAVREEGVKMGPLAHDRRLTAIEGFVSDAVEKGAKILTGGKRHGNKGYFFP